MAIVRMNSRSHQGPSRVSPWSHPILLYINDLPESLQSQVCLFADDTAVYLTVQGQADSKKLQNDLDILQEWERESDMEFNPSKCQVVHITRSRRPINTSYSMHGQVLDSVDSARYLGVDITSDLNFTQHINRTTSLQTLLKVLAI